jgi:4-hydroxy-L-threonine phosphate dehydrogenase PdxA
LSASPPTIALAIGDPNGIGPEIAVKAAVALDDGPLRIVLVGDPFIIRHYAAQVANGFAVREVAAGDAPLAQTIDVLPVAAMPRDSFVPGRVEAAAGRATVAYVEAALGLVRANHARSIVGCPHNETAVNAAGIPFSGYPSLIARLSGTPEDRVFLMLVGGRLRILHATLHERLQNALQRLTPDLVEAAGQVCANALASLGIDRPRIGLCAINPHAGEGGLFGDDDEHITAPAAERLRRAGIAVEGPIGADLLLGRADLDGFVAMYHDQGHIPIKLIAGRTASALTVGAGIVFSSVGHGSAFDIAGRGTADPAGILRAIDLVSGVGIRGETLDDVRHSYRRG